MSKEISSRIVRRKRFLQDFAYASFAILTWAPALIFFNTHVAEIISINGPSMYPFLNTNYDENQSRDLCLVSKWNPLENLQRGMIIVFRTPNKPEVRAVKRIIALEYDKVHIRAPFPSPTAEIPAGHVWVEGDNEDGGKTLDSNHYGPIAMNLITGRVTHVLFPWRKLGPIRWWEFKTRTKVLERVE